jgi:hypothetical protein
LALLVFLVDMPGDFWHSLDMAAPVTTAGTALPAKTLDTRRCGYHHRPLASCELVSTVCPTGGVEVQPSPEGPTVYACLCPICVERVA